MNTESSEVKPGCTGHTSLLADSKMGYTRHKNKHLFACLVIKYTALRVLYQYCTCPPDQTTSGLKIVSHILGALFNPGLVLIAVALLATKKPNLFFLPQFKCFYWPPLFESTCFERIASDITITVFCVFFYKYFRSLNY